MLQQRRLNFLLPVWCLFILLLLTSGCLGPVKKLYPEKEQQRPIPVYVVSHGWHVAIAFEGAYLREKLPGNDQLPNTHFLMVGWGDNKYYPSEKARIGLFLRAAFLPTGSVIHVVGFNEPVDGYFSGSDIVRVQVSKQGMKKMTGYIAECFRTDAKGDLKYAADGLYQNSVFFEAKGLYFFPKTSNKWTARILRESGFPITPFYALTSGNVMQQVRKSGTVIQQ